MSKEQVTHPIISSILTAIEEEYSAMVPKEKQDAYDMQVDIGINEDEINQQNTLE